MAVRRWRVSECDVLQKAGIQSRQLVWPKSTTDAQATVTHVVMAPGAVSQRHAHAKSEQIWIVERGEGRLLLADGREEPLGAGDVVLTPMGDVHGVANTGASELVYLAVTVPPQDFSAAYGAAPGEEGASPRSRPPAP